MECSVPLYNHFAYIYKWNAPFLRNHFLLRSHHNNFILTQLFFKTFLLLMLFLSTSNYYISSLPSILQPNTI